MSRSGYSDDCDNNWSHIQWRGRVASATKGKRGQKLLRDILAGMDALPVKELITNDLEVQGAFCALGVAGHVRGVTMQDIDPDDYEMVAVEFDVAAPLVQEIAYMNDEAYWDHSPAERFTRMQAWVESKIKGEAP